MKAASTRLSLPVFGLGLVAAALGAAPFHVEVPGPGENKTRQQVAPEATNSRGVREAPARKAGRKPGRKAARSQTEPTNRRSVRPTRKEPPFRARIRRPVPTKAIETARSTGTIDFPGRRLGVLLEEWKERPARSSKQMAAERHARIDGLLPPGRYRFQGHCALLLQGRRMRVRNECLGSADRTALLGDFTTPGPNIRGYFSPEEGERELRGVVTLERASWREDRLELRWGESELRFSNPFLELLRERLPHLPEEARRHPEYVSLLLPELLRIALAKPDAVELRAVLGGQMTLTFSDRCPLRLVNGPTWLPAEGRRRLVLSMACGATGRLGRIDLYVPADLSLPKELRAGVRLSAQVRLAGIVRDGHQLRLVWDSISNLRPLDP